MNERYESINIEGQRLDILRRAREYLAKGNAEMETGSSDSMRHILNNALSPLNMLVQRIEKDPDALKDMLKTEDNISDFNMVFKALDSYFELLEKYPNFKAGEKAEKTGYFSDKGIKVPAKVDSYREALEKEGQT